MECDDAATESSEQIASSGHAKNSTILNNHAAQLVNQVISRTQCTECGKHFRKGEKNFSSTIKFYFIHSK